MPINRLTAFHGPRLDALRACAESAEGLPANAYPAVMPVLEAMGVVVRQTSIANRPARFFLTAAGRKTAEALGIEVPK